MLSIPIKHDNAELHVIVVKYLLNYHTTLVYYSTLPSERFDAIVLRWFNTLEWFTGSNFTNKFELTCLNG